VRHFGAESAEAMFGLEERLGRGLLQVSMLENDPSLSPADRARRIQAIRDSLPEFRAIEFMNIATSTPDDESE
jgi:lipase chaperone LimK